MSRIEKNYRYVLFVKDLHLIESNLKFVLGTI